MHDVNLLDEIMPEARGIIMMNRAYVDLAIHGTPLYSIHFIFFFFFFFFFCFFFFFNFQVSLLQPPKPPSDRCRDSKSGPRRRW